MSTLAPFSQARVFVEITPRTLTLVHRTAQREWALERNENGRITASCQDTLQGEIRAFLDRGRWRPRLRAWCAIGAGGVSLRRLKLPRASAEELHRLVLLQIEGEFPLAPDQLAWGYLSLDSRDGTPDPATQDVLVAAVRKDVIEDYSRLLAQCGLQPVFTLAGLTRSYLGPASGKSGAFVDLGEHQAELLCFDPSGPVSLRSIGWGIVPQAGGSPSWPLDAVVRALPGTGANRKILLSGAGARDQGIVLRLSQHLGSGSECESIDLSSDNGTPAAIRGLRKAVEERDSRSLLLLEVKPSERSSVGPVPWKWVALASFLVIAVALAPYLEAFLFKPRLAATLATLKLDQNRLTLIDREFSFLRYLKQNQPPYTEALMILARIVPAGSRIDLLTLNRSGELSLKGTLPGSQQVVDFRSKLVDSGFFSSVTVAEQSPAPDRRQVLVRIDAHWKSSEARDRLPILAAEDESKPADSNAPHQPGPLP